ncbi:SDR family NAD(P)-dependent oxidoreductase [Cyanobacterium aponinum AL20118]|uniref:SDR family NAD(P)-dependent oxidoreductase n=1 Tax=Cyanobacterium aponinum AL20115 TaxID=3090662 RepID=A0AAF0ZBP3_9CHRO|nr:SDR family NAD(P)-dependent oxidoreductase [Cyanobacterium aponinum]WPF88998.1 SDR family NAD(P)-dependent oxidoreductase [Cyanobacterium aponinum AL20115]
MKKTIVITGVSKGLGRALSEKFIALGHTIIGCSRSQNSIKDLQQKYPQHYFSTLDVSNDEQVKTWIQSFPNIPDLVINNAAVINYPAPLWEISAEDFSYLIDVNIKGTANVIRHVVPVMMKREQGIIVNLSSGWGRSTSPEVAPYCASKWAIEGLTQALAQELPSGIATIALNPGIIHTQMLDICFGDEAQYYTPINQWVEKAVPFLLKLSTKNNGQSLTVS